MKKTKKSKAFDLFSQGFTPSSPEVKAIGLHPSNRYKYFGEWEKLGKPAEPARKGQSSTVSSTRPNGETIGSLNETKARPRVLESEPQPEETAAQLEEEPEEEPGVEPEPELWPEDISEEERARAARTLPETTDEIIGGVSEVVTPKTKDGKPVGPEQKIATTVAEDGIKCTVLLSLQTLTLYSIAKSTQAQLGENGDGELSMGDFLDTCAEDFFRVRGKKLGLINSGGR